MKTTVNLNEIEVYTGSKQILIRDDANAISFPTLIHYPTHEPSTPTGFGPYTMDVCVDGSIPDEQFPLIVISHGNGGSHLLYRSISTHLAKNGYIVAMVEHYGNNRNNNTLENTTANLVNRPRHVSLAIDTLLTESFFTNHIAIDKIGVIGHSMGGYTALALAGGIPWTREGQRIEVSSDSRIKTIVLLAPGAGWFMNSLRNVTLPILMLTAEHDPITPPWNADVVLNGVPDPSQVTFRQIENAGHFSFLTPFPDALKKPGFIPATDPEGFDRDKFHTQLPNEVFEFLTDTLYRSVKRTNKVKY